MLSKIVVVIVTVAVVLMSLSLGMVLLPSDTSVAWTVFVMTPFVAISLLMILLGGFALFYKDPETAEPSNSAPDNVHELEHYR